MHCWKSWNLLLRPGCGPCDGCEPLAPMIQDREKIPNFDAVGAADKDVLAALDGGFCNKVFFGRKLDRIELVARCRKDAKLCFRAEPGGRAFYSNETFKPESVRTDDNRPWLIARCFHGGSWREMKYKEVTNVLWQKGSGRRPLRLKWKQIPKNSGILRPKPA